MDRDFLLAEAGKDCRTHFLDLGSDNCTNKPFEFGKGHRVHQKCEIFDEETSAYWNKYARWGEGAVKVAKYGVCSFWRVIFWGIYRLKNRETIAGQSSPDGQSDELKTDSEQNHDKHIAIQDLIETKSKTDWYLATRTWQLGWSKSS